MAWLELEITALIILTRRDFGASNEFAYLDSVGSVAGKTHLV